VNENDFDIEQKLSRRLPKVAAVTGFTMAFLRKEIRAGNLIARKRGGVLYVLEDDLRAYLAEGEKVAAQNQSYESGG